MADVTLTINGKVVTVPQGSTIMDAARKLGVFIPTFCYDPELTRTGSCRICVVEIMGSKNLKMSCAAPAKDGMVVETDSPAVLEARKTILELMLANHSGDCLSCGRNGDCRLQDYSHLYGARRNWAQYAGQAQSHPVEDNNPFFIIDKNNCIMCGKCIRMCAEVQGNNAIDVTYRELGKVDTAEKPIRFPAHGKMPLPVFRTNAGREVRATLPASGQCVFCGNCVAVCPTGALQEKALRSSARTWEVNKVRTVCPYCGTGCSLDLNVKDGRVVGVTSCDGGVNGRALCAKGRFGFGFIHHPDRLTAPLIKKDGHFVEATWDEAIGLVAEKLGTIRDRHGPDSLAVLASARCTTEDNYLLMKLTRAVLGTNNIDHCARL